MAQSGLNFVHLSDIHLVKDFSDVSNYDLDLGLRQAILRDIERMKPAFENIAGVLVSGDIAFAGKLDEYERAIALRPASAISPTSGFMCRARSASIRRSLP
jgi:hypothetical protein